MVSSLSAFSAYQKKMGSNTAWVWEHQALTRARFCAGSLEARRSFDRIREDVLRMPREQQALRDEIVQMRQKIREGHPNPTEQFDLKHDAGGMVDIEFMIQYIVLQYAIKQPSLLENVGNIGLIIRAGQTGIIAPELAHQVADAYRLFRKKQHQLRLDGHALARVAPELMDEALEQARSQVLQLWQQLMT
jgi:glutamate-ammonia-ligase adenylyltransferase